MGVAAMSGHTFDVVVRPADDWIEYDTWQLVCSCGILSGASYRTRDEALREPRHTRHWTGGKGGQR